MRKDKLPLTSGTSNSTEIADFLQKAANLPVRASDSGRLIFAMDATASREPAWDAACELQGQMFEQTQRMGGLNVQLVYYRGYNEFFTSKWVNKPSDLNYTMSAVRCLGGMTQISKILQHAISETAVKKINAVIFVGDAMEESIDNLCALAGKLGILGVPVFLFQENSDPVATMAFQQIAKLTNGAHSVFDSNSAQQLKDLLSAVAIYAAGGHKALAIFSKRKGGIVLSLTHQLQHHSKKK